MMLRNAMRYVYRKVCMQQGTRHNSPLNIMSVIASCLTGTPKRESIVISERGRSPDL